MGLLPLAPKASASANFATPANKTDVRPARIELASRPWQGRVLPLNHGRLFYLFINFSIALLFFHDLICFSLLKADDLSENSSVNNTFHGMPFFVDFTNPLLCIIKRLFIFSQLPT